jgi:predicted dehydrogenase
MQMKILLVGTGPMAVDYFKVLSHLGLPFEVVGRGKDPANTFEMKTNYHPKYGGVESYINENGLNGFTHAIIAVGPEKLLEVTLFLFEKGIQKILVEKPAAVSIDQLLEKKQNLKTFQNRLFVAYNRRFYKSVEIAKNIIEEDGGLKSMSFEFTELIDRIAKRPRPVEVLNNWFFANSTHVIDLAFHFAGKPTIINAIAKSGNLDWHKTTNYAGSGVTDRGVLFSYLSNWESAGRWGVELMTSSRRILLRPLEKVQIQKRNTFEIIEPDFDYSEDLQFKPGLLNQLKSFLAGESNICDIADHIENTELVFTPILNGTHILE